MGTIKRGIIFDLDGTLWDSSEEVANSWNEVFRDYESPFAEKDVKGVMGLKMDEIVEALFVKRFGKEVGESLGMKALLYETQYLMDHPGTPMEGAYETLKRLKDDYLLYIVSNCQEGYIETFLNIPGFSSLFDGFLSWGARKKEKGENIAYLMEKEGLEEAVYVGDTLTDEKAARTAKIPFIHAAYGFGNAKEPCFSISSLTGLREVLERLWKKEDDSPFKLLERLLELGKGKEAQNLLSLKREKLFALSPFKTFNLEVLSYEMMGDLADLTEALKAYDELPYVSQAFEEALAFERINIRKRDKKAARLEYQDEELRSFLKGDGKERALLALREIGAKKELIEKFEDELLELVTVSSSDVLKTLATELLISKRNGKSFVLRKNGKEYRIDPRTAPMMIVEDPGYQEAIVLLGKRGLEEDARLEIEEALANYALEKAPELTWPKERAKEKLLAFLEVFGLESGGDEKDVADIRSVLTSIKPF